MGRIAIRIGMLGWLCVASPILASAQQAQAPTSGWSLSYSFAPSLTNNALDETTKPHADAFLAQDLGLAHRWMLMPGTTFSISGAAQSELYAHQSGGGINRGVLAASLAQSVAGGTLSLGASARTALNQHLTSHDSANQDINLAFTRPFALAPHWTLSISSAGSRRLYQDGTEDQWRARLGATLSRKIEALTLSLSGGLSYALEDPTPIKPRIRDQGWSISAGASYEIMKDREIGLKISYTRTYSSYWENRTKTLTFAPSASATWRY